MPRALGREHEHDPDQAGRARTTRDGADAGDGRHGDARHGVGPATSGDDAARGTRGRARPLAAALTAELAREEAAVPAAVPTRLAAPSAGPDRALWDDGPLPLFPLQPPRTGRELLADHVTAMVCCAAVDTAGAAPGLDWLDGPALLVDGERRGRPGPRVLSLVEDGDAAPLRAWLAASGVRPEKPVRLV